jgi:hypothetical protein
VNGLKHQKDKHSDFLFISTNIGRHGTAIEFACLMYTRLAPMENGYDKDYFCDGGRSFGGRGRSRDFASRANRAACGGRHCRHPQRHPGILLSSTLLPPTLLSSVLLPSTLLPPALASLLVAPRLSALLVMPAPSHGAVPLPQGPLHDR